MQQPTTYLWLHLCSTKVRMVFFLLINSWFLAWYRLIFTNFRIFPGEFWLFLDFFVSALYFLAVFEPFLRLIATFLAKFFCYFDQHFTLLCLVFQCFQAFLNKGLVLGPLRTKSEPILSSFYSKLKLISFLPSLARFFWSDYH